MRPIKLTESLATQPSASIPIAASGWSETKGAYRLLENEHVEPLEILGCHSRKTEERALSHAVVLCLQDTTELDFSSQQGIAGLGRLNYDARQGMYVHPTLMVTPDGQALGVIDAWMWARKPKGEEDVKESIRWKEGYGIVADMAERVSDTRFVYVADREADLRELIQEAYQRQHVADYLVRVKHNRKLEEKDLKLWESVASTTVLGQIEFTLEANGERKARQVRQTLYAQRVKLKKQRKNDADLEVTIILAQEETPPEGQKPIVWRLLTNRLVETLEQAAEMVDWYRRRWLIEIFFRILKTGCRVESLQLSRIERLERALAIYLIIAWRILHVVTSGQQCPELPCDVIFDTEEWQAAWIVKHRSKPPETPPQLGEMVRLIAGFGGFLGRKHDGFPGAKAIWEGMEKVRHYAVGIEVGKAVFTPLG
jgi:hypothetical protein